MVSPEKSATERWVYLDLPHMREVRDALEKGMEEKYGKDRFRRLERADPEGQRETVTLALGKARAWYEKLGYLDKVFLVGQIEKAYTEGSLTLSDLLQGLGLKTPGDNSKRGILGGLRKFLGR